MDFVKLTHENIEKEHICCAIANNKDIQVMSKKNWLKEIEIIFIKIEVLTLFLTIINGNGLKINR